MAKTNTKPAIEIKPFLLDQQKIYWHGTHVGYCGTKPRMPINFLAGKNCLLNDNERADCLAAVIAALGQVKMTKQTKRYFDVLAERQPDSGDPAADESPDSGADPAGE